MPLYEKCLRCGRKLKAEESKIKGFGKVCWERYNALPTNKLFEVNINASIKCADDLQAPSSTE